MLCSQAVNKDRVNEWMTRVVVLTSGGSRIVGGDYDGYGNVGHVDLADIDYTGEGFNIYHQACYDVLRQPEYDETKRSRPSADQGWFFDDLDHAVAEPKCEADLRVWHYDSDSMKAGRESRAAAARAERKRIEEAFKPLVDWHIETNSEFFQGLKESYSARGVNYPERIDWPYKIQRELEAIERERLQANWERQIENLGEGENCPPEPEYDPWRHIERLRSMYPSIFQVAS